MLKKSASKTIDINTQIVEELLSKSEPLELFGKDGIFNQLKKQSRNSRCLLSDHRLDFNFIFLVATEEI